MTIPPSSIPTGWPKKAPELERWRAVVQQHRPGRWTRFKGQLSVMPGVKHLARYSESLQAARARCLEYLHFEAPAREAFREMLQRRAPQIPSADLAQLINQHIRFFSDVDADKVSTIYRAVNHMQMQTRREAAPEVALSGAGASASMRGSAPMHGSSGSMRPGEWLQGHRAEVEATIGESLRASGTASEAAMRQQTQAVMNEVAERIAALSQDPIEAAADTSQLVQRIALEEARLEFKFQSAIRHDVDMCLESSSIVQRAGLSHAQRESIRDLLVDHCATHLRASGGASRMSNLAARVDAFASEWLALLDVPRDAKGAVVDGSISGGEALFGHPASDFSASSLRHGVALRQLRGVAHRLSRPDGFAFASAAAFQSAHERLRLRILATPEDQLDLSGKNLEHEFRSDLNAQWDAAAGAAHS